MAIVQTDIGAHGKWNLTQNVVSNQGPIAHDQRLKLPPGMCAGLQMCYLCLYVQKDAEESIFFLI